MGAGEYNAGGGGGGLPCDGLAFDPVESRNTPSHFTLQKPEIIAGLMGLLGL